MKKILTVLLVVGALTAAADDSYLYWMVGDLGGVAYDTVKIQDTANNTYLNIYNGNGVDKGESISRTVVDNYRSMGMGLYAALTTDPATASYVIELWNSTSGFLLQSSELSYSDAYAQYVVSNNAMTLPNMWQPGGYAIPEPNSALLVLLGCAALGLRRRRLMKA